MPAVTRLTAATEIAAMRVVERMALSRMVELPDRLDHLVAFTESCAVIARPCRSRIVTRTANVPAEA